MTSHRKCIFAVIDGLGDLPVESLGGRTPLEAARTPVLNQLGSTGTFGLVDPVSPGQIPNTHSGTGLLFGALPAQVARLHRGPVEALGAGSNLANGDIAMRANFATVEMSEGRLLVTDRRAGRISESTDELAKNLQQVELGDGIRAELQPTDQHRAALILSGPGLDARVSDTDPGDGNIPCAVRKSNALSPAAVFTADKLNLFVELAHERLQHLEINHRREAQGQLPANGIITRGAGVMCDFDNVLGERGIRAAVVAGCNTIRGLARISGFGVISDPAFTADLDTDIDAKIAAALSVLSEYDLVYVHFKAPDICAHDLNPDAKRDALERFDRALAAAVEVDAIIAVGSDHSTDSNTGAHTADPVPVLLHDPRNHSEGDDGAMNFSERACASGNMPRQTGHQFLRRLLDMMS
jgi:2,3-bisphosphoglycerate-independent phosphoglycerate mutase